MTISLPIAGTKFCYSLDGTVPDSATCTEIIADRNPKPVPTVVAICCFMVAFRSKRQARRAGQMLNRIPVKMDRPNATDHT